MVALEQLFNFSESQLPHLHNMNNTHQVDWFEDTR